MTIKEALAVLSTVRLIHMRTPSARPWAREFSERLKGEVAATVRAAAEMAAEADIEAASRRARWESKTMLDHEAQTKWVPPALANGSRWSRFTLRLGDASFPARIVGIDASLRFYTLEAAGEDVAILSLESLIVEESTSCALIGARASEADRDQAREKIYSLKLRGHPRPARVTSSAPDGLARAMARRTSEGGWIDRRTELLLRTINNPPPRRSAP